MQVNAYIHVYGQAVGQSFKKVNHKGVYFELKRWLAYDFYTVPNMLARQRLFY